MDRETLQREIATIVERHTAREQSQDIGPVLGHLAALLAYGTPL